MKSRIFFILFLFAIASSCFGQSGLKRKTKFKFLYILNFHDRMPISTENAFIDPSEQDTTYTLSRYKDICNLLKVDGIIFIRVKASSILLTLNDVFKLYGINEKYKELPVMVDDDLIYRPETMLMSKNQIEKVVIMKQANHYCLHISLNGYYELKKNIHLVVTLSIEG